MGSLVLTESHWATFCKLNFAVVRIKVSFNFLNISADVKLFFINFFSSGIKSVFCIAANSCDPALEFLKGVTRPELFHAYMSITFKQPMKSLTNHAGSYTEPVLGKGSCCITSFWTMTFSLFKLLPITATFKLCWQTAKIRCSGMFFEIKSLFRTTKSMLGLCFPIQLSVFLSSAFNCSCSEYETAIFCPFLPLICKWVLWFWLGLEGNLPCCECCFLQIAFLSGLRWEQSLWLIVSHIYSYSNKV